MSSAENIYLNTAELYDLDERNVIKYDIPFFIDYAQKTGSPILELACGTGRVTIPLASAGYEIWGLDLSETMLNVFRDKTKKLPAPISKRIKLIQGDMCKFELAKEFPLVIIPFRSFQTLVEDHQQAACLQLVHKHLQEGGIFIIDVFRPYGRLDETWARGETLDWEKVDPSTGCVIKKTNISRKIDVQRQIIYPELVYYIKDKSGEETKITDKLSLKYYYDDQIRKLLKENGFVITEEMGYYDRRPLEEGPELIFVCRK